MKDDLVPPCVPAAVAASSAVEVKEADRRSYAFIMERHRRTAIQASLTATDRVGSDDVYAFGMVLWKLVTFWKYH